jgi:putative N6-adenine-specific DNA methylase
MKEIAEDFPMVAKTVAGLEEVLADELLKLGAKNIEKLNRAVLFTGDKGFMYKANLNLRTALRILKPIKSFEISNEQSLYDEIRKISWDEYITFKDTIAIDTVLSTDLFTHSQFISQKTKDAIADQFREKYQARPSVDLDHPTLRINLHIAGTTCSVSLDSSGDSLHKRGYRDKTNLAPINEVLAAGLVLLSGWDKRSNFIDPMCGSGTIAIEAALYANNIPPGYFRKEFGFERWKDFDKELWDLIFESSVSKISDHQQKIIASDISKHVSRKAKENVKLAKVEDVVTVETASFEELEPPAGRGVVIMNPPYGERMDKDDLEVLYKSIGDTLKKKYKGYTAWIISSNMEAFKFIGLRPTRKIQVFNGPLECRFMKFEMYKGTKKVHKLGMKE